MFLLPSLTSLVTACLPFSGLVRRTGHFVNVKLVQQVGPVLEVGAVASSLVPGWNAESAGKYCCQPVQRQAQNLATDFLCCGRYMANALTHEDWLYALLSRPARTRPEIWL